MTSETIQSTAVTPAASGPERETRPARTPAWLTALALVALGVSLAVAAYVALEQRTGTGQRLAELRTEAQARRTELEALALRLDEVATARRRLDEDLNRLSERLNRESDALSDLPDRLGQLEQRIERFAGPGDRVRAAWLLAEAEHYLRIANAQLGLAGDVEVAQTALGLADESLRELADPRFTAVRKEIAEELAALRAVPRPDIEGIVLTLGSLADSLEGLPLKQTAPADFRAVAKPPEEGLTGLERALAAARNAFFSLVNVRRTDAPLSPLLSDAEQVILVRSLDLELQLARLAIMRGDSGMYRRSIAAATDRVRQNFDPSSARVQAVLTSLTELSTAELPDELPDISASLAALAQARGQVTPSP